MLVNNQMTCDACKQEFVDSQQFSHYYCKQCNKLFTLCPSCRNNWAAEDVAGSINSKNDNHKICQDAALDDNLIKKQSFNLLTSGNIVSKVPVFAPSIQTTPSIHNLSSNPIFQLSLSSKELFHSNFLLWLADNYPNIFNVILHKCFKANLVFDPTKHVALREFKKLDFCICENKNNKVGRILFVLENKFKSLPSLKQLEDYEIVVNAHNSGNDTNTHFVLLTLTQDLPWMGIQNGLVRNRWVHVTYNDYAKAFDCIRSYGACLDLFTTELIKKYQDYIDVFSDYLQQNISSVINISTNNFNWSDMSCKMMKQLRTDDIWQKLVASRIASLIEKGLNNVGKNACFNNLGTKELLQNGVQNDTIYISIGFSRGTALIDVKRRIDDKCIYGVQIQNGYYKRVLESVSSIVGPDPCQLFTDYLKNGMFSNKFNYQSFNPSFKWYDSNPNIFTSPEIHPKASHDCQAGLKGFGGYGNTFIYQSKEIDSSSISDVVDEIVADILT